MLPDPENMGETVIISLLPCVQAEIYVFEVLKLPSWFSTSGDILTCDYYQYNTSGMSAAENVAVVVRMLF